VTAGLPVVLRAAASRDVDEALAHYEEEAGAAVARSFIDALERTFLHVGRHPATGSPRYATELGLPGLRAWPLDGFPYLVFYVQRQGSVDVWRLLQAQRDIPAWLVGPAAAGSGPPEVRERPAQYVVLHDEVW
jgi:toxin ParE1/3/4